MLYIWHAEHKPSSLPGSVGERRSCSFQMRHNLLVDTEHGNAHAGSAFVWNRAACQNPVQWAGGLYHSTGIMRRLEQASMKDAPEYPGQKDPTNLVCLAFASVMASDLCMHLLHLELVLAEDLHPGRQLATGPSLPPGPETASNQDSDLDSQSQDTHPMRPLSVAKVCGFTSFQHRWTWHRFIDLCQARHLHHERGPSKDCL